MKGVLFSPAAIARQGRQMATTLRLQEDIKPGCKLPQIILMLKLVHKALKGQACPAAGLLQAGPEQRLPCTPQCPEDFDWGCGWPGGPMICSATRSFMFWRMKASSRWGASFQCVVSATLLRICVASNLQGSSHSFRQAASCLSSCGHATAASEWCRMQALQRWLHGLSVQGTCVPLAHLCQFRKLLKG